MKENLYRNLKASNLLIGLLILTFAVSIEACMKPCPKLFSPICGRRSTDNMMQTFENECLLENLNCENPSQRFEKTANGECVMGGSSTLGPVKFVS
jgi:Kazal-type serine protease inhibitor domain